MTGKNPYQPPAAHLADPTTMSKVDVAALAQLEHGGFGIRLLATLIDMTILFVPMLIAYRLIILVLPENVAGLMSTYIVWAPYSVLFLGSRLGGTPGKLICGLKVLAADGRPLDEALALKRLLAIIVSSYILVGPLFIPFTARRQALHDLIAKTVVVKRSALAKFSTAPLSV